MSQEIVAEYAVLYGRFNNIEDVNADDSIYEIIEFGNWEDDGKYSHCTHIVKYKDVYISVNESRSGSYFADYHYGDAYIQQVERKEEVRVVVTWPSVGKHVEAPAKY